jgi:hypothetical protein
VLYFAYGSNLNREAMALRCPAAKPLGPLTLRDSRLVFRGVADCIYEEGSECPGAVWKLTPACEASLDRYEGVSGGFYRKEYVTITGVEGEDQMLLYVMNSTGIFPPSEGYYQTIRQGYRDFGLPLKQLRDAVKAAWDDKAPSHRERQRHRRNGRPALAAIKRDDVKKSAPAKITRRQRKALTTIAGIPEGVTLDMMGSLGFHADVMDPLNAVGLVRTHIATMANPKGMRVTWFHATDAGRALVKQN